ncbi:MAG: aminotransferase class IV [Desulfobacterium sp.]|nr:aminotransferase class IV [Desulfobacterium sp.]
MDIYYIDGEFVTAEESTITVNDMALLRGYGVFDFMRTYGGKPFFLDGHVKRLIRSATLIGMTTPWSEQEIVDITMETLGRNNHEESNVRIVITGGVSPDSITPQGHPSLLVMVTPLHALPEIWYTEGVKVITSHLERFIPDAKTTNYIPGIMALENAKKQNAIESIYVDRHGNLLEGTTTNFWAFIDNKLVTPATGMLPGITRKVILELADTEVEVEMRDIKKDEIRIMDEAFLTASNKEIVPVTEIDCVTIGDGTPGKHTQKLTQLFKEFTTRYGKGE